MTEPTTPIKALIVPNTGDLVGAWGTSALNPDFTALDGMLGGLATISLSSATTFSLSAPTGSITPGAGPNQSQNALIRFSGTLTGNAVITFPLPGFYIVENLCTVGAFYVQITNGGGGEAIAAPPGKQQQIFSDGTNVRFCSLPEVGTYMDIAVATTPGWLGGCTKPPWLYCNGATFSATTYPFLFVALGTTTLPDQRGRFRAAINDGTSRIDSGSGVNGNTLLAAGGVASAAISTSNLPASLPYTDLGHTHGELGGDTASGSATPLNQGANQSRQGAVGTIGTSTVGITINPGSPNTAFPVIPPTLMGGMTFIRAG